MSVCCAMQVLRLCPHVTGKGGEYTFATDTLPDKAGIDPLLLLVDRVPDDNLKKVSLVQ